MAALNSHQAMVVTRGVLLLGEVGDVLAEHEQDIVAEVARRFRKYGVETTMTGPEWLVVEEAVEAMTKARDKRRAA